MTTPVLLDCDPGHDDAIALLLALASPEIELLGVTTVSGNQTLEKTTANAIRILDFVGEGNIEVAAGADRPFARERFVASEMHGDSGLDGPALPAPQRGPSTADAVDFIASRLSSAPEPATLVPTGPLTNVALLLARYPDIVERVDRIVLMGGAIAEGNMTPAAEFNIWADPEAAWRVFESGLDVTMIGLDVTHKALMTSEHGAQLRAAGRTGTMVAELLEFFNRFHRETYGFAGSPVHDAVAVAHVVNRDFVQTVERHVAIERESNLCRGRTVVDLWGRTENKPNAKVAIDIKAEAFLEFLISRLSTFP